MNPASSITIVPGRRRPTRESPRLWQFVQKGVSG